MQSNVCWKMEWKVRLSGEESLTDQGARGRLGEA